MSVKIKGLKLWEGENFARVLTSLSKKKTKKIEKKKPVIDKLRTLQDYLKEKIPTKIWYAW